MKEITVGELYGVLYDCSIEIITHFNTQEIVIIPEYDNIENFPEDLKSIKVEKCRIVNGCFNSCAVIEVSWEELKKIGVKIVNNEVVFHPYFIYVVSADNYDYEEYDKFTVVAKSEARAEVLAHEYFAPHQFPINIKCICSCDATKEEILTFSFNAG